MSNLSNSTKVVHSHISSPKIIHTRSSTFGKRSSLKNNSSTPKNKQESIVKKILSPSFEEKLLPKPRYRSISASSNTFNESSKIVINFDNSKAVTPDINLNLQETKKFTNQKHNVSLTNDECHFYPIIRLQKSASESSTSTITSRSECDTSFAQSPYNNILLNPNLASKSNISVTNLKQIIECKLSPGITNLSINQCKTAFKRCKALGKSTLTQTATPFRKKSSKKSIRKLHSTIESKDPTEASTVSIDNVQENCSYSSLEGLNDSSVELQMYNDQSVVSNKYDHLGKKTISASVPVEVMQAKTIESKYNKQNNIQKQTPEIPLNPNISINNSISQLQTSSNLLNEYYTSKQTFEKQKYKRQSSEFNLNLKEIDEFDDYYEASALTSRSMRKLNSRYPTFTNINSRGDGTGPLCIQTIEGPKEYINNTIFKFDGHINHDYLKELLTSPLHRDKNIILIDCRFPYEYKYGHIKSATNLYSTTKIKDRLFSSPAVKIDKKNLTARPKKTLLVVYCEFSTYRAPYIGNFIREHDRNMNNYPNLKYPELVLLSNGYSSFYNRFKNTKDEHYLFNPAPRYRQMYDINFRNQELKYSKMFAKNRNIIKSTTSIKHKHLNQIGIKSPKFTKIFNPTPVKVACSQPTVGSNYTPTNSHKIITRRVANEILSHKYDLSAGANRKAGKRKRTTSIVEKIESTLDIESSVNKKDESTKSSVLSDDVLNCCDLSLSFDDSPKRKCTRNCTPKRNKIDQKIGSEIRKRPF